MLNEIYFYIKMKSVIIHLIFIVILFATVATKGTFKVHSHSGSWCDYETGLGKVNIQVIQEGQAKDKVSFNMTLVDDGENKYSAQCSIDPEKFIPEPEEPEEPEEPKESDEPKKSDEPEKPENPEQGDKENEPGKTDINVDIDIEEKEGEGKDTEKEPIDEDVEKEDKEDKGDKGDKEDKESIDVDVDVEKEDKDTTEVDDDVEKEDKGDK